MARGQSRGGRRPRKAIKPAGKAVKDYRHDEAKRPNNPSVGLAQYDTEKPAKRRFEYDPHLDPQLVWAGKAERTSFEVEAPSIHVHESLSTEAVIAAVKKEQPQLSLFGDEELDRSKAIEFYQHEMGWKNRLILGDSLVVMTSLIEKERLGGRVQVIYFDPPYGIDFTKNFQARMSNRSPREGSDESVTREPEQIRAFRDTWTLEIHSYLAYIRDQLMVGRELLRESGSVLIQIGPDNVHLVRTVADEIFGRHNACPIITVAKTSGHEATLLPEVADFLLWYAKDKKQVKYRQLFEERQEKGDAYKYVELPDGTRRAMTPDERADPRRLQSGSRIFRYGDITAQGTSRSVPFEFEGRVFHPGPNLQWKIRVEGMEGLARAGRLGVLGNTLSYIRYLDDFSAIRRTNIWTDTGVAGFTDRKKQYVVETNPKIIERALLMSTDPGDLVLDPTIGSGTTAYVSEKFGRRWIGIDTSRIAVALTRERILTAKFDYFKLMDPERGVDGGLQYRSLKRVTASSIGYGKLAEDEVLWDQPLIDRDKVRVSGPFTVEALSRYSSNPLEEESFELGSPQNEALDHVKQLLDALSAHGIPRRDGKPIKIETLQPLADVGPLQAEGTFHSNGSEKRFAVSLGPRFGAITPRQIDEALAEAYGYDLVVFAGFAAHAESQQMLRTGKRGRYEVALLLANPDLLVGDLLKTTPSSQTFRLFSAPDVQLKKTEDREYTVELLGVDTFDAATGEVSAASKVDVAGWFLDQDYDGVVFHVTQGFFPRSGGWEALQRALKGTIDPKLFDKLESFESLPFKAGDNRRIAVRVITDDGNASETVLDLDGRVSEALEKSR